MLVESGYDVRAVSQYNSFNNWGWPEGIRCLNDVEVITGDVRDSSCRSAVQGVDDFPFGDVDRYSLFLCRASLLPKLT